MFKRREPRSILKKVRETLWPSMGWIRMLKYARNRALRLSDTSRKIAAGLAIGVVVSFTPFVGTHFIQAALIAYLLRANVIAALIGTLVGNPWTFPFMWWAGISFGNMLFGLLGLPAAAALPEIVNLSIFLDLMVSEPARVFLPWILGSYLIALLVWPFFYVLFYTLIKSAKRAKSRARLRKLHKVAKDLTGQKD